jgi:hypothetical protein
MNQPARDPVPSPEPALLEIHEHRCPVCKSERIAHAGRIIAGAGMMKVELRCTVCGTAFFIANTTIY